MKPIIAALGILATLLTFGQVLGEEDHYGKQKVVYHINDDDPAHQASALGNIQNHINAVGPGNLDLKVVMHGNGLSLLLYPDAAADTKLERGNANEALQAKITGLKNQGVDFLVCANTLEAKQVELENLYDVSEADVVPSGVAELSRLQGMGYTYIKP
jgi:intracellular sulfur oxidation DsrE/DsrF family protein